MDQKDTARFGGLAFGTVLSGPNELSFEHEVLSGLSRLIRLMVLIFVALRSYSETQA